MDIRDLRLYLHLCDSGNFSQTAKEMYISPSTLSRQIQRLEAQLGQALFIRDNRSVQITEAGTLFKHFATQTLQHYQQLQHQLKSDQTELVGELRLFCSVTAAYSHLPDILDQFRVQYPAVEIKLTTGDAADAVKKIQSNEADLAIAGRPKLLPAGINFADIGNIEMTLFMPKLKTNFSAQLHQSSPNWQQIPFILPEHGPSRRKIDRWFKQQKILQPHIYATVAGHEAIVSMIALGCGVALLPKVVIENSPDRIRERILEWPKNLVDPFEIGVCVQKKRLSEHVIAAFWQLVS
ncbi:HTH-type transcriptional activator IlvY [Utexia brackfieldae]|uniref:HTH-type transcriptional activator IlvY n=1 Tax=Utexia brackfieldae TaxID=3074108 RepID=UPI00370DCEA1